MRIASVGPGLKLSHAFRSRIAHLVKSLTITLCLSCARSQTSLAT